ncbi:hypothetical protein RR46_08882 [Papilio xuthus]|uniref:Uncharacterized protein n=1 Tax=Papilio xuthus TaxID=66420 RepID=A0A194PR37_PAPXU|nr:hypothetical protein RR46_08882 [Papilio xuthus]
METLSHFIEPDLINGRRSMMSHEENEISKKITSKNLCQDLPLCDGRSSFVDNYLILLTTAVDSILKTSPIKELSLKLFYEDLPQILRDVRKILKSANAKVSDSTEFYYWNSVLKKVSGKFHGFLTLTLIENFKDYDNTNDIKNVIQKIVTALVIIETKYVNKLCIEHKICIKSFECTKALHRILEKLTSLPDNGIRSFMKHFYEALFATTFYSRLSIVTTREFQVILNNLAFSNNVSAKDLLQSVQKSVEMRLDLITTPSDKQMGYDVILIHIILSDLDHFYSKNKQFSFYNFIKYFIDWNTDGTLGKHLRKLMNDIGHEVTVQPHELPIKITNEVRVFLELTIDPDE